MTDDPEFEGRVRRELREHVEQVEPRGSLAALRERIARRGRHRRRRLRKAARSVPEPETELLPAVAAGPVVRHSRPAAAWSRCPCGRLTYHGWCCWHCMAASDGGWQLAPYRPGARWTDTHTWTCDLRQVERDPRWYAAPARSSR